jgi:hypothetical protein
MSETYKDFDLILTWSEETKRISVHYQQGNISSDQPVVYDETLIKSVKNKDAYLPMWEYKPVGLHLADILLPNGDGENTIRSQFRQLLWNERKKIRLRLIYPDPEMANNDEEKGNLKNQRDALLNIPWEFIYLSEDDDSNLDKYEYDSKYLLSLRDDVSIVHCLTKHCLNLAGSANKPLVDPGLKLKLQMKYFSALSQKDKNYADNNNKLINIYKKFRKEYQADLRDLITWSNSSDLEEPPSINGQGDSPDEYDITIGLRTDHIVHLTSHGEPGAILLGNEEITLSELIDAIELTKKYNAKVIILLSCCSSSGDMAVNIAAQLHQKGVPLVIGMSGTIQPEAGGRFVEGFYNTLAAWPSDGLEKAVVNGRLSMFQEKGTDKRHASFALPRLLLNSSDSILIPERLLFGTDEKLLFFENIIQAAQAAKKCNDHHPKTTIWQDLLKEWITHKQTKSFLMTGSAGSGKTFQIAWLLDELRQDQELQIIFHFCDNSAEWTIEPLSFIRYSIVPQLQTLFGDRYESRITPGRFPLRVSNEDDAFWDFVVEPLNKLKEEGIIDPDKLPVFIIDGLDVLPRAEDQARHNSILGLLFRYRDDLEKVARVLVTADYEKEDEVTSVIEDIFLLTYHHRDRDPNLIIEKYENKLMLFVKLQDRLEPLGGAATSIQEALKSLQSHPAYAQRKTVAAASIQEPLESLHFYQLFEDAIRYIRKKYGDTAIELLNIVALSYEPLHKNDVASLLDIQSDSEEFLRLLENLQPLLKNYEDYGDKLIPFHGIIKNFLLYEMNIHNDRRVAPTHERFVRAFLPEEEGWSKISNWSNLTGSKWGKDNMADYVCRYLSHHAYNSYFYTPWDALHVRKGRADDFIDLICDPRFREARLDKVGLSSSMLDLQLGLRVIYTEHIHNLSPEEPYEDAYPQEKHNKQARRALDRFMETYKTGFALRRKLIEFEEAFRKETATGKGNRKVLEEFLFEKSS